MRRVIGLFLAGGPVMWPILALSVIGVAILVWKVMRIRAGDVGRKGMVVVSTIITAEPMLGILGTVTGIMQTFSSLGVTGGGGNPLAATAGIGEALVTTAAGLVASLILIFPYNVVNDRLDGSDADRQSRSRDE